MESYFGDIGGSLVYKYMDGGNMVSYIQDPGILLGYGGELYRECVWDVCGCTVNDNNDPYCYGCWESREQHKEESNLDELRKTQHTIEITRDAFHLSILPWIEEYANHFEPCRSDLYYDWDNFTVLMFGDYAMPCGPNAHLLGQYLLFKQIQYFFHNSIREDCIIQYTNK